ncbi:MAG: hypothetical protein AMJ66_11315 [Betaproteobacteria bacterium SG8_40]|nr:MAG: hypothetical protein AMJ66_11315 [Betaproteobacteria bacterium SG8_40]
MRWLLPAMILTAGMAQAMPPQHVELSFEIRFGKLQLGVGEDRLEHDGKHYEVYNDTIPKGIAAIFINDIRRESKGSITSTGLRPVSFIEHGRKNGIRAAEFDWSNNKLRLIHDETNEIVDLPEGAIDQASLPYAFAFAGKVPESFTVHVTDGRRLAQYQYRIVGNERIASALGELETIHIEKVRGPEDKRSFEFWVATEHNYLPVQMRFTDKKGRRFDSVVTAIRYP